MGKAVHYLGAFAIVVVAVWVANAITNPLIKTDPGNPPNG